VVVQLKPVESPADGAGRVGAGAPTVFAEPPGSATQPGCGGHVVGIRDAAGEPLLVSSGHRFGACAWVIHDATAGPIDRAKSASETHACTDVPVTITRPSVSAAILSAIASQASGFVRILRVTMNRFTPTALFRRTSASAAFGVSCSLVIDTLLWISIVLYGKHRLT